jgi:hypothetical protein
VVIVAVHLLVCVPHASAAPGAGSTAVWAAIAGVARHHAVTGTSQMPHGTSPQVTGGGGANVEHVCVTVAVEERTGADSVSASTGLALTLFCTPGVADPPSQLLRAVPEGNPSRCMILRC